MYNCGNNDGKRPNDENRAQESREAQGQGQEECKPLYGRGFLGTFGRESEIAGTDEISFGGKNSPQRTIGQRTLGGIIRQLRASKEEHLKWVEAHADRLKARLAEDESMKERLKNEIENLTRELDEL